MLTVPANERHDNPSRLLRAFKRLSWQMSGEDKTPDPIAHGEPQSDVPIQSEIEDGRRSSMSFFRPTTRLSTYSSTLNHRADKKVKQAYLNLDSKIKIELKCSNEDGIYRPGDILQGQVNLDGRDMQGRQLRSVKIHIEGKARVPRYEIRSNSLNDNLERVVRTRQWLFYTSQKKVFPHKKNQSSLEAHKEEEGQFDAFTLPFTFEIPKKDTSAENSGGIISHSTPGWRKPVNLPPSCELDDENDDMAAQAPVSMKNIFQTKGRQHGCNITYSVIVEVQWQRNVLSSNKMQAKIDFILHPSPPTTACIISNLERPGRQQRQRVSQPFRTSNAIYTSNNTRIAGNSAATNSTSAERVNGQTNWREERPSYLSQRLSRELASMIPNVNTLDESSNREVAVCHSRRGPRGWYIERLTQHLDNGEQVLIEFSHPAVPCLLMDKEIPFEVRVTYPTFNEEGIKLVASDVHLDLLRHINSFSLGGRLCLESKNKISKSEDDSNIIHISDLKSKDVSEAPTDEYSSRGTSSNESRRSFTGTLRISSGLDQAQESLNASRSITLNAISQEKVTITSKASRITLPSFRFRGLSVDYSFNICISLKQERNNYEGEINTLPLIQAFAETSLVRLQSKCTASSYLPETREMQLDHNSSILTSRVIETPLLNSSPIIDANVVSLGVDEITTEEASHQESTNQDSLSASLPSSLGHVNISLSSSMVQQTQNQSSPSLTINNDTKESMIQNLPSHTTAADHYNERQREDLEYVHNTNISASARERSGTLASCFSAQTLDGLPPPYCSPNLSEFRRL